MPGARRGGRGRLHRPATARRHDRRARPGRRLRPSLAALAADHLDPDGLVAAGERFGFGTSLDLPLPSATPDLPVPVDTTELVRAAAGQARVLASPLHVATMLAAAGEGTWHAPYLLRDGEVERPSAELSPTATEDLRRLLELGGTAPGSAPASGRSAPAASSGRPR